MSNGIDKNGAVNAENGTRINEIHIWHFGAVALLREAAPGGEPARQCAQLYRRHGVVLVPTEYRQDCLEGRSEPH
jgi:hypothetical protein